MIGFDFFNTIGTIASIVGAINALKGSNNSTAADLFKESCKEAVRQSAPHFADVTTSEEFGVDTDTFITLLKNVDISTLTSLEENAALAKITAIFQKCIKLPGSQLGTADLKQRLQPVIKNTFAIFFESLPRNQQATNEIILKFVRSQAEAIKENTNQSGKIDKTTQNIYDALLDLAAKVPDFSSRHLDMSTSVVEAALEKEQQSAIDNAKDLLRNNKPQSAIASLENLKRRIWESTSPTVRYSILTNMASALFALNKKEEAAGLVIEAFQYIVDFRITYTY